MHAKVLVVDRETALVGSANLTGHALERIGGPRALAILREGPGTLTARRDGSAPARAFPGLAHPTPR